MVYRFQGRKELIVVFASPVGVKPRNQLAQRILGPVVRPTMLPAGQENEKQPELRQLSQEKNIFAQRLARSRPIVLDAAGFSNRPSQKATGDAGNDGWNSSIGGLPP